MFNLPLFVGLDYHQNIIQVCVMDQTRKILANESVENSPEAVARVVLRFGSKVNVAIEACTGAAQFAEELIAQYSWHVELAHPGYVARMKQTPDKSDWTDAKVLADLTRVGYIPRVWLAPEYIRNLRDLVRHRHGLLGQRTQSKLRLRALLRNHRITCPESPWTKKGRKWLLDETNIKIPHLLFLLRDLYDTIDFFDKKIGSAEDEMLTAVSEDAVVAQLMTHAGIGFITAITMRALIGHFDRFRSGKQLANFCAVTPRNNSSGGKTTTGGLIKAGDELLRSILIEAAHRLIRFNSDWKAMSDRLRANGKKTCVIVAAVANRWVRKLFYQMTQPKPSDEETLGFPRHGHESAYACDEKCAASAREKILRCFDRKKAENTEGSVL